MCSAPETCSHFGPRLTSSHFCSVILIASRRSPVFMRALAAAEPGSIDLAIIPCGVSTQAIPSVGGPWLCDRCQKLIAPATNKSSAVASSSQVLVVSTELFILLSFRDVNHAHVSHTASTKRRQPMFQLNTDESVRLLHKLLTFVPVS